MERELFMAELFRLVSELKQLEGMYVDQFYQVAQDRFRIKVGERGSKTNLNIAIPYYVAVSDRAEVNDEASNFSIAIRKRISGSRIKSVSLYNSDRIIRMELERKESGSNLIFEMFGRGNLVLADSDMKILMAYKPHEFSDRSVRHGETYLTPKNTSVDFTDKKAIENVFANMDSSEGKLVPYLSRQIGIGNLYVEDSLLRSGLDPKVKIKGMAKNDLESVMKNLLDIAERASIGKETFVYYDGDNAIDFAVCDLFKYSKLRKTACETISAALELLYSKGMPVKVEKDEALERILASISKQEASIAMIEKESVACRLKGQFISANTGPINQAIKLMQERKDLDAKGAAETINSIKIIKIDRKMKKFTIETDDGK